MTPVVAARRLAVWTGGYSGSRLSTASPAPSAASGGCLPTRSAPLPVPRAWCPGGGAATCIAAQRRPPLWLDVAAVIPTCSPTSAVRSAAASWSPDERHFHPCGPRGHAGRPAARAGRGSRAGRDDGDLFTTRRASGSWRGCWSTPTAGCARKGSPGTSTCSRTTRTPRATPTAAMRTTWFPVRGSRDASSALEPPRPAPDGIRPRPTARADAIIPTQLAAQHVRRSQRPLDRRDRAHASASWGQRDGVVLTLRASPVVTSADDRGRVAAPMASCTTGRCADPRISARSARPHRTQRVALGHRAHAAIGAAEHGNFHLRNACAGQRPPPASGASAAISANRPPGRAAGHRPMTPARVPL